ncbi:MAG: transposase [Acidobacteriota bacterium]|nr:transposase [Acidobacteriota bacterium]
MVRDYIEFQDRNAPLAYLSIRLYGTWLHGDERGSMNRRTNNLFGTLKIHFNPNLAKHEISLLKHPPIKLNAQQRIVVENAIRKVCETRLYKLFALQVRTNHVHVVVSAVGKPEFIMNSFKAYSTRHLRKNGLLADKSKLWSRHGSTRYLWTESHIEMAVDYVINEQGDDLPNFD